LDATWRVGEFEGQAKAAHLFLVDMQRRVASKNRPGKIVIVDEYRGKPHPQTKNQRKAHVYWKDHISA
jgi:hypothetical protein